MKWFLIDKSKTEQPDQGKYADWKEIVREEGRKQCAYCATHEGLFGGLRNFHVEHYRPQKRFPHLENVIGNLFYSCAICNSFKGYSWPAEPDSKHAVAAFPCPAEVDYSQLIEFTDDYHLKSGYVAGEFVVERLFLNRPQLVSFRRLSALRSKLKALVSEIPTLLESDKEHSPAATAEVMKQQSNVMQLLLELGDIAPYEAGDVKR